MMRRTAAPNSSTTPSNTHTVGESTAQNHLSNSTPLPPPTTNDFELDVAIWQSTDDDIRNSSQHADEFNRFLDGVIVPEISIELVDTIFPKVADYPSPILDSVTDSPRSSLFREYQVPNQSSSIGTVSTEDMEVHVDLNPSHVDDTITASIVQPSPEPHPVQDNVAVNRRITRSSRRNQNQQVEQRDESSQRIRLERNTYIAEGQRYLEFANLIDIQETKSPPEKKPGT